MASTSKSIKEQAGKPRRLEEPVSDGRAVAADEASEKQSPKDRVVKDVVRGLYEGRIQPGQRLIEAQLTDDYGTSRGPVREALNRLDTMGIVDLMPQRGAIVRQLSVKEAIDSLTVVQSLIGTTARLAAQKIDVEDKKRLERIITVLKKYDETSSSAEYALARDQFYSTLSSLADNSALSRILTQLHIHLIRVQFREVLRTLDRKRHSDYLQIADAVSSGDQSRAERLARRHIARSISALQKFADAQAE